MGTLKVKGGDGSWKNVLALKGDAGDAAGFGNVTATVDNNVGTPEVNVTATGPDTAKNFNFDFKNLKGEDGEPGVYIGAEAPSDDDIKVWIDTSDDTTSPIETLTFEMMDGTMKTVTVATI